MLTSISWKSYWKQIGITQAISVALALGSYVIAAVWSDASTDITTRAFYVSAALAIIVMLTMVIRGITKTSPLSIGWFIVVSGLMVGHAVLHEVLALGERVTDPSPLLAVLFAVAFAWAFTYDRDLRLIVPKPVSYLSFGLTYATIIIGISVLQSLWQ